MTIFGTPTEESFPGVWELPYFHQNFPRWPGSFRAEVVPYLPKEIAQLVQRILVYRSSARPTADDVLNMDLLSDINCDSFAAA